MFWFCFGACFVTAPQTSPDKSIDIGTTLSNTPIEEQELRALELLRDNPEKFEEICPYILSEAGKKTCSTYASRPHLWTISSQSAPVWEGGFFFSRLYFPKVKRPAVRPNDASCNGNTDCIFQRASQKSKEGKTEEAKNTCASVTNERQQWECMFQASEVIHPPQYKAAAEMCLLSGSFSPECHNHLMLRLVQDAWLSPEKHNRYRNEIETYWGSGLYSNMLLDLYWSALASRTLGVIQPFSTEDVPVSAPGFVSHIHSALALRVIFSSEPLRLAKKAKQQTVQLNKAHGPNSPVFIPKRIWDGDKEHTWIHFCDLRGGIRPTSPNADEDLKLALMTAAMMTNPPKVDLVQRLSENGTPLILWAKDELLSAKE